MTTYLLVRHGTTAWVDTQFLHGITDIPLNEKGRTQAADAAKALKSCGAKMMYASSLSRCGETAQIIAKSIGIEPILKDELVEIDFGWLEGRRIRDHDYGEYSKLLEFFDHHVFNIVRTLSGEPKKKFRKRILDAWQLINKENPTGVVLIVSHSGVINVILMHLFGNQYLNGESYHHLNPCSITEIKINSDGRPEMVRLNDLNHILKEDS